MQFRHFDRAQRRLTVFTKGDLRGVNHLDLRESTADWLLAVEKNSAGDRPEEENPVPLVVSV